MKQTMNYCLAGIMLLWIAASTHAAIFTYTREFRYLNDLAAFGYGLVQEGFEDDAVWGIARTPHTAKSITNFGITWTSNNENSEITTGSGPARTGMWGFYSLPHGDFVHGITDGFIGKSVDKLFGFGGWLETNTPPAKINIILDGVRVIDFEDLPLDTRHKFFGVIDTTGFVEFEARETEGTLDDQKFIFADDFTFGTLTTLEAPLTYLLVRRGVKLGGGLESLKLSDDDYLLIDAELNNSETIYSMDTLISATSPETIISRLDLTIELAADSDKTWAIVRLRNFDTNQWDVLEVFALSQSDTQKVFLNLPNPEAYVHDTNGQIKIRIVSIAKSQQVPNGYIVRIDRVRVEVVP